MNELEKQDTMLQVSFGVANKMYETLLLARSVEVEYSDNPLEMANDAIAKQKAAIDEVLDMMALHRFME